VAATHAPLTSAKLKPSPASSSSPPPVLVQLLKNQGVDGWAGVVAVDSGDRPWDSCAEGTVTYLTADSPNILEEIVATHTYVIGGLVDHKDKPRASLDRASAHGLPTARLPIELYAKMRSRDRAPTPDGGVDVTTLAVVQIMLLRRTTGNWGDAVSQCAAMHCAPMRKYVTWLPPYLHLNGATKPSTLVGPSTEVTAVVAAATAAIVVPADG
jgi:tRNA (guanine9-N1)-methyltransferase